MPLIWTIDSRTGRSLDDSLFARFPIAHQVFDVDLLKIDYKCHTP